MTNITEFLLARIAEDEAAARAAEWVPDPDDPTDDYDSPWSTEHSEFAGRGGPRFGFILRNNPARVLAECAAKRAIIERIPKGSDEYRPGWFTGESALYALAAVYNDHPDYRPEWALTTR